MRGQGLATLKEYLTAAISEEFATRYPDDSALLYGVLDLVCNRDVSWDAAVLRADAALVRLGASTLGEWERRTRGLNFDMPHHRCVRPATAVPAAACVGTALHAPRAQLHCVGPRMAVHPRKRSAELLRAPVLHLCSRAAGYAAVAKEAGVHQVDDDGFHWVSQLGGAWHCACCARVWAPYTPRALRAPAANAWAVGPMAAHPAVLYCRTASRQLGHCTRCPHHHAMNITTRSPWAAATLLKNASHHAWLLATGAQAAAACMGVGHTSPCPFAASLALQDLSAKRTSSC